MCRFLYKLLLKNGQKSCILFFNKKKFSEAGNMKAVAAQQNKANRPTCASALSVCQSAPTCDKKRTDAAQAASVFAFFSGVCRLPYLTRFYLYAHAHVRLRRFVRWPSVPRCPSFAKRGCIRSLHECREEPRGVTERAVLPEQDTRPSFFRLMGETRRVRALLQNKSKIQTNKQTNKGEHHEQSS